MVSATFVTVGLIAWAFSVHLPLVYTVLGLGWLLPTLELIGYKRNKQVYVDLARNLSSYLIAVYAIGGLFGTIITVFLAGLLPIFTNIAGALLWPVWGVAIVFGVAIALPFIGFYYRGFGRIDPMKHVAVGYSMAIALTVIPAMFRLVFAFINYPAGVEVFKNPTSIVGFTLGINWGQVFLNPTYAPLFLATLFGAIAITGILVSSIFGWRYSRDPSEYRLVGYRVGNWVGLVFGVLYSIFAGLYLYEVYQYSPTVAWSIFGKPPAYLPSSLYPVYQPTLILSGVLYMDVALGLILLILLALSFKFVGNKAISALKLVLVLALMVSAEVMNGLAHLPYAIVPPLAAVPVLVKAYGLQFTLQVADTLKVSTLLTPQLNALLQLVSEEPGLLYGSLVVFAFFNALLLYVIYAALSWRWAPITKASAQSS
ncbi:cytochrome ubiquinol oxidase subunit I [Vulcanisaeta thermophila]|uniref:cytochrome ubiquinol oxidase subunit I n=1 Tax=Vulcanisaeta thermophila TaxID=867917 RepID=UPI000852DB1C|nr:cytochrome ubiquinol oxidase subunit I [Vulcanisaeta thermophila]